MTTRPVHVALACVLPIAVLGCSRDAAPPQERSEAPVMTPAAGPAAPGDRPTRPRCAENFAAFDDDGDGRISEDEFHARPHAHANADEVFRDRDDDGDGQLTESEFCSGWRHGPPPAQAPGPGAGTRPAPGPGPGSGMGPGAGMGPGMGPMHGGMGPRRMGGSMRGMHCEQHFEAFDADNDGKLTKDEFAAWPHARGDADALFTERDRDADGTITGEEFCLAWR